MDYHEFDPRGLIAEAYNICRAPKAARPARSKRCSRPMAERIPTTRWARCCATGSAVPRARPGGVAAQGGVAQT